MRDLISIIVPVYNVEKYLEECLNSLIAQTYDNIEIIIINDGSPDDSDKIISKYIERDKRIILIDQDNKGLSVSRNIGISKASGNYIMFVDSDDYLDVKTCEYLIDAIIQSNSAPDILIFGRYRFDGTKLMLDDIGDYSVVLSGDEYISNTVEDNIFTASSCNKVFRTKFLRDNNFFFEPAILYEDLLFVFKSLINSQRVLCINKPLYFYRIVRDGSITNTVNERDLDVLITVKKLKEALNGRQCSIRLRDSIFPKLVFSWVANAVYFKYPQNYPFSRKANKIVKQILHNPVYLKYVRKIISDNTAPSLWRIAGFLSLYCYPLFVLSMYLYKRISK